MIMCTIRGKACLINPDHLWGECVIRRINVSIVILSQDYKSYIFVSDMMWIIDKLGRTNNIRECGLL